MTTPEPRSGAGSGTPITTPEPRSGAGSGTPITTPEPTSIGECVRCGKDIRLPADGVVWVADGSYHRACHDAQVAIEIAEQVSLRQAAPAVGAAQGPAGDGGSAAA